MSQPQAGQAFIGRLEIRQDPIGEGIHLNLPAFEGPMDLLLYLIRREEVDIFDIPIARIADEYLRSLQLMEEANLEVGGDFLVMAATLLSIKARMLLPRPSFDEGEVYEEDPRRALVERILEYKAFKESAELFRCLEEEQSNRFWRGSASLPEEPRAHQALRDVTLYDLLLAFKLAIDRCQADKPRYSVRRLAETIEKRLEHLRQRFQESRKIAFSTLAKELNSRLSVIVTFLAILEMVRLGEITLRGVVDNDFLLVVKKI